MLRIIIATFRNKIYAKVSTSIWIDRFPHRRSGEFYRYGKNETDAKPIFLAIFATDIPVPVHPVSHFLRKYRIIMISMQLTQDETPKLLGHKVLNVSRIVESLNFLMHQWFSLTKKEEFINKYLR